MLEYAALAASPRALPDSLILVFQHPAERPPAMVFYIDNSGICPYMKPMRTTAGRKPARFLFMFF